MWEFKQCSRCRTVKPLGDFHNDKTRSGGLRLWCKTCVKEQRIGKRRKGQVRTVESKRCSRCKLVKPFSEFSRNTTRHDGLQSYCRDCNREKWHERHQASRTPPKEKPMPVEAPAASPVPAVQPPAANVAPQFVEAGPYLFGIGAIALVDRSRAGCVEIKLNIHEVNGHGFPEALGFVFEGADADAINSALSTVTGRANSDMAALRARVQELEAQAAGRAHQWAVEMEQLRVERDAALELAGDLEKRVSRIRADLGL